MTGVGRRAFIGATVGFGAGLGLATGADRAAAQPSPVVWTAESGGAVRDYLIEGEDVYVGTDQNRLRRLREADGEEVGQVDLSAGVYPGGMVATADHVVVATEDDRLSVYERSDLVGSGATPAWEPPLSGQPVGMDAHDGAVVLATRDGLVVLEPSSQGFRWQRYTDDLDFDLLGPPVVWDDSGIVVTGDTSVLFVSPESGEVAVTVGFDAPNHINVLKKPPVAVTSAGPYVGYSGADAHGCCPSWATLVIDTERRDIEYRSFGRTSGQKSLGLTETSVVHRIDDQRIRFEEFESGSQFRMSLSPRFDGIASADSRTFVADSSAENAETRLVAIENEGFGEAWSHAFDEPVAYLEVAGDLLFGLNREAGRLLALSRTGDRADVVGTPTPDGSDGPTPTGRAMSTDEGDDTGDDRAASQGSGSSPGEPNAGEGTGGEPPSRGFFTNGENTIVDGIGLTGASTAITVVGILVTMVDMLRGDGN